MKKLTAIALVAVMALSIGTSAFAKNVKPIEEVVDALTATVDTVKASVGALTASVGTLTARVTNVEQQQQDTASKLAQLEQKQPTLTPAQREAEMLYNIRTELNNLGYAYTDAIMVRDVLVLETSISSSLFNANKTPSEFYFAVQNNEDTAEEQIVEKYTGKNVKQVEPNGIYMHVILD